MSPFIWAEKKSRIVVKNEKQDAKAITAFIGEAFKVSDGALVGETTVRKIALTRGCKLSQKEFEKTI